MYSGINEDSDTRSDDFNLRDIDFTIEGEELEYENLEKEKERLKNERTENERLEKENERLERERIERKRIEMEIIEIERLISSIHVNKKNQKTSIKEKQNKTNKENVILPKTPTLVIATYDFYGEEYDHLDIKKGEYLIVTDWNCSEKGWVYGHRKDDEEEKGIFPEVFIQIC